MGVHKWSGARAEQSDRQRLGPPISPQLPPVFGPSCMRQKLVPRTVRRPSPTPAIMVRL